MENINGDSHSHDGIKRFKKDDDSSGDPMHPNPSIVVHVRNLNPKASEADLMEALSHFGTISYATCVPHRRMALVEFEDINAAKSCVNYAMSNNINVAGSPALFNYSTSPKIQRLGLESDVPNRIAVLTILNPQYQITADTIYQICKPHGDIKRVALIRRNQLQALVEFDSVESARRAKSALNGADIYAGCCTVKFEFSGAQQVRVYRNDSEQWDYTAGAVFSNDGENKRAGLLSGGQPTPVSNVYNGPAFVGATAGQQTYGAPAAAAATNYGPTNGPAGQGYFSSPPRSGGGMQGYQGGYSNGQSRASAMSSSYGGGYDGGYQSSGPVYDDQYGGGAQDPFQMSCVVMVYGVDQEKIDCDKLFNLFCLYGNIIRMKFMKSKLDTAMVQMGDPDQVKSVVDNLNNVEFDGMKLTLKISVQPTLREIRDPFPLPSGEASFKNFERSRNNRFTSSEVIGRNRMLYPTCYVHWFNAPGNMTEEKMSEILSAHNCKPPKKVLIYNQTDRSSVGMAEFETVEEAVSAVVHNNHTSVDSPIGKLPYVVKLAFTRPKSDRPPKRNLE